MDWIPHRELELTCEERGRKRRQFAWSAAIWWLKDIIKSGYPQVNSIS